MLSSWTIAKIRGIPLRLHWTMLLALPFFAYVMAMGYFADGEQLTTTSLAWGAALAVSLFASVLLHEMSHSLMALRLGAEVRSILLMPLGGISQMAKMPERPRDEFLVTVVGPLTNFLIAGPALILAYGLLTPGTGLTVFVGWVGWVNVTVGAFNLLVPAFPLDGGRLLRAALAQRLGRRRATALAAAIGRAMAFAMGAFGILAFGAGGIWLIMIALFIYLGASAEERATTVLAMLAGLQAKDLMTPDPVTVSPEDHLDEVLQQMLHTRHTALPVVDGGRVLGCITLDILGPVPPAQRPLIRARDAMTGQLPKVAPDLPAVKVLEILQNVPHHHAVVMDDGLAGIISAHDLQRIVAVMQAMDGSSAR